MENIKTLFGQIKQENKQTNSSIEKRNNKLDLIIKNKNSKIILKDRYIEVINEIRQIYGIKNIKRLYIHKDINLSVSSCYNISKYIKIFFIDANGNIVAKYKRIKKL